MQSKNDQSVASFFNLSPDVVLASAEQAGFRTTGQFVQLNSLENRVFALEVEAGSLNCFTRIDGKPADANAVQIVLKFYRPERWSIEQIIEEQAFIADLAQSGFPVCVPLTINSGASTGIAKAEGIFWAAWTRTAGRIPDEFDDSMIDHFGELLARLHTVGATGTAAKRISLNADAFIRKPLDFLIQERFIPAQLQDRYRRCALDAADALDRSLEGMPIQRIHGDCHWGNLLSKGNELVFLDFDDFMNGPVVQDIWMITPAVDPVGMRQRDRMLAAYRKVRDFDDRWLDAVNPLKAARYIHYASWIARRFVDPSFPHAFPQFGTDEYWDTEVRDLEDLIRTGFTAAFTEEKGWKETEDYSHLTNKDYFFDM